MSGSVTYFPGRRGVQDDMPNERQHRQELARAVNTLMSGQNNSTFSVTLKANASSTMITDSRISKQTAVHLVPATADAAAELAGGALFVTASAGQAVISHANNSKTDRTFTGALIG